MTGSDVDVEDIPSGSADTVSESEDEAGEEEKIDLHIGMRRFPCIAD